MVLCNKRTKLSARKLSEALQARHYSGKNINYGSSSLRYTGEVLNKPEAVANAVNKRVALEMMRDADLPTLLVDLTETSSDLRLVGRPDHHSQGRYFYICAGVEGVNQAMALRRHPATHFMKYLTDFREFRVHIVNGKCIKISEKSGGEGTQNHRNGATFHYPENFNHKKTLRKLSKQAVECLGLDLGAVDLIYKDGKFYLLEVNTAPCLTDETSDTLDRYVEAFCE